MRKWVKKLDKNEIVESEGMSEMGKWVRKLENEWKSTENVKTWKNSEKVKNKWDWEKWAI
jgi:hypothetical protein